MRSRHTTFLVALTVAGDDGARGPVVYAVMKPSAEEALAAVRALAGASAQVASAPAASVQVAVVGSLSTRTAKAIKLKPGEVRVV